MECSWRGLGEVLEVSWNLLEGSWRRREGFRQQLGGVLEAFEGFLDAPESILEASGGYMVNYMKNLVFFDVFLCFFRSWAPAGPCFGG